MARAPVYREARNNLAPAFGRNALGAVSTIQNSLDTVLAQYEARRKRGREDATNEAIALSLQQDAPRTDLFPEADAASVWNAVLNRRQSDDTLLNSVSSRALNAANVNRANAGIGLTEAQTEVAEAGLPSIKAANTPKAIAEEEERRSLILELSERQVDNAEARTDLIGQQTENARITGQTGLLTAQAGLENTRLRGEAIQIELDNLLRLEQEEKIDRSNALLFDTDVGNQAEALVEDVSRAVLIDFRNASDQITAQYENGEIGEIEKESLLQQAQNDRDARIESAKEDVLTEAIRRARANSSKFILPGGTKGQAWMERSNYNQELKNFIANDTLLGEMAAERMLKLAEERRTNVSNTAAGTNLKHVEITAGGLPQYSRNPLGMNPDSAANLLRISNKAFQDESEFSTEALKNAASIVDNNRSAVQYLSQLGIETRRELFTEADLLASSMQAFGSDLIREEQQDAQIEAGANPQGYIDGVNREIRDRAFAENVEQSFGLTQVNEMGITSVPKDSQIRTTTNLNKKAEIKEALKEVERFVYANNSNLSENVREELMDYHHHLVSGAPLTAWQEAKSVPGAIGRYFTGSKKQQTYLTNSQIDDAIADLKEYLEDVKGTIE